MTEAAAPPRPVPEPDDATAPYWEHCRNHELRVQRCAGCQKVRFPPQPMCPGCGSLETEWIATAGRGTVYSWVVCHGPVLPAFQADLPFAVVLVELEDHPGVRIVGNLRGTEPSEIEIGQPVEVIFEEVTPGITLPQWRPWPDPA